MSFYRFDDQGKQIRKRTVIDCQAAVEAGEKVLVEQSHKQEVDINNIVKKHGADLVTQVADLSQFVFDDVVGNDFQEMMNGMIKAKDTFANVPSKIRAQFDNDAAQFMDFVLNKDNKEQLIEWGLAEREPPPPEPVQVAVVSQPVETTETPVA